MQAPIQREDRLDYARIAYLGGEMALRYLRQGWKVEILELSESGIKGLKSVSAIVEGPDAGPRLLTVDSPTFTEVISAYNAVKFSCTGGSCSFKYQLCHIPGPWL